MDRSALGTFHPKLQPELGEDFYVQELRIEGGLLQQSTADSDEWMNRLKLF